MAKDKNFATLASGDWDALQAAVERFEAAWDAGSPPRIDDYLPATPAQRVPLLVELIHVDLERRLKRGEAVRVEAYLERYPELARHQDVVTNLIAAEFEQRHRREPKLAVADYLRRFPQFQAELAKCLPANADSPVDDPSATQAYAATETNAALALTPRPVATVAALVKILRDGDFLKQVHLEKLTRDLQTRFKDPVLLANELVTRWGWLTRYQADFILRGKVAELTFGSYLLLEPLGKGGMGQVFKATHRIMKRTVALKIIRREHVMDAEAVRRFHREIEVAAKLAHPNVVAAYDASEVNGVQFFAMEFVEGTDLARVLRDKGRLPTTTACEYVRQVALGLEHGHERGMVHRDIKPANLILTPAADRSLGLVKILDMGLARFQYDTGDERGKVRTRLGIMMGTPDYVSPEQIVDAHNVDIRSDIYSLGCTLYHLLTGEKPYAGKTVDDKIAGHLNRPARPAQEICPDLPRGLDELIRKMMAKKAADRFQTPAEVATALLPYCVAAISRVALAPAELTPTATVAPAVARPAAAVLPTAISAIPVSGFVPVAIAAGPTTTPTIVQKKQGRLKLLVVGIAALVIVGGFAVLMLFLGLWLWPREPLTEIDVDAPVPYVSQLPSYDPPPGEPALTIGPGINVPFDPQYLRALNSVNIPESCRFDGQPKELVAAFESEKDWLEKIAWSPDGRSLLTGGVRGLAQWDLATGKEMHRIGVANVGYGMTLSASGLRMAFSSLGVVIDLEQWKQVKAFNFASDAITYTADDRYLLAGYRAGPSYVKLHDAQTGEVVRQFKGDLAFVDCVVGSPDGRHALSASRAGFMHLWDLQSGKELRRFDHPQHQQVLSVAFSPEGQYAYSGIGNGTIYRWNLNDPKEAPTLYEGLSSMSRTLQLTPNGKTLAAGGFTKRIVVWDVASRAIRYQWDFPDVCFDIAWARDGRHLAVANKNGIAYILRLPSASKGS